MLKLIYFKYSLAKFNVKGSKESFREVESSI